MLLYGDVGFDFTPKTVAEALKKSKGDVNVRISSGGGSAFEGLAIYNLLRASGRRVEVDIDGLAASAASVIAMAGEEIRISEAALMMVHNSSNGVHGHAEDLRELADVLDKLDHAIAASYARKSGRSQESFRVLMKDETWMTPQQALNAGLVDKITGAQAVAASVKSARSWAELPDEVKAKLQAPTAAAIVAEVASSGAKEDMTPEQLAKALADALAPFAARLIALETSASAEDESEDELEVDVEETAESELDADVKTMFDAAVSATFDRFVAANKIAPAGREHFAAACATAAGFKAVCALYEAAPAVAATAPLTLPAVKTEETRTYSAEALAWAERSKIDVTKLQGSK